MPRRLAAGWRWCAATAVAGGIGLLSGPTLYANLSTTGLRYDANHTALASVPKRPVAVIFGAGVLADGTLTNYLQERVSTGVALYKAGRVNRLVMSGDNSNAHYNEPERMADFAASHGVPRRDIILDYAGYSTYDTCYRAARIFGLSAAMLVTQSYHLPRATMTCRGFGLDVVGVSVQHRRRDYTLAYLGREVVSTDKAIIQLVFKPRPTVEGPLLPISKNESSAVE